MKVKYTSTQAKKYEKFIENSFGWKYLEKPVLEKHLKPILSNTKKILDAGCGTGKSIELLIKLGAKEGNILGTDISQDMLNIAQKKLPNINFIQADLPELTLEKNSLDIILSNMMLQYLSKEEWQNVTKKFSKWLVKGGTLIFIVVHPVRFMSHYSNYFNEKSETEKTPWNTVIEYYPKKASDYINAVINAGLDVVCVEEPEPEKKRTKSTKDFKKYFTRPTRLMIKAVKR